MVTLAQCRDALDELSAGLAGADGDVRAAAALDRSLSCHLKDLDVTFTGRLHNGRIVVSGQHPGPPRERARIRLALTGEDLVALVSGRLDFARAWAAGRVRIEAGFRDLLRLRKLL
ncbi:sterol-binding protein [Streptomyces sp. PmtG]